MTPEQLPVESRTDPVIGMPFGAITEEMARESVDLYLDQLGISGLLRVRDIARNEVARQEKQNG